MKNTEDRDESKQLRTAENREAVSGGREPAAESPGEQRFLIQMLSKGVLLWNK